MDKNEVVKSLKEYFEAQDNIIAVYLFGSYAKNQNRRNSDIDIALLFTNDISNLERFDRKLSIANELEDIYNRSIDVVDLSDADIFLIHQIMKNKILIIDKDTTKRVAFETDYRKKYFDRKPFFEIYYNTALKQLEKM